MNQKGFYLLDVLAGILIIVPLMSGAYALTRSGFGLGVMFSEEAESQLTLISANAHIVQMGRLAEVCIKRDEDDNGTFELVCTIRRHGLEEVRFLHTRTDTDDVLLFQRKVGGLWETELSYSGIINFIICDNDDVKQDITTPASNACPIIDKNVSRIYTNSHNGITRNFFRISLSSMSTNSRHRRQNVQSSFFVRNSVNYNDGNRYVFGWSDAN